MIHIFPYLLCRIGGESIRLAQPRQSQRFDDLLSTLALQQADCLTQKDALSQDLLTYLQEQQGAWQKQVHNFRRDLYNDRSTKPATEVSLLSQLPSALQKQVHTYRTTQQAVAAIRQEWEAAYQAMLLDHRAEVQALAGHEALRQGLVLSSPDLLAKLDTFAQVPPQTFRKRENHTEQSLLKYLTRMVAKTSPFSTFTNLAIGRSSSTASNSYALVRQNELPAQGHVRLNNYIYKILRDLLWAYLPIFRHVGVRPNPTLRQQPQQRQWLYLTNVNNVESFQRLPLQPVLNAILDILHQRPDLTFGGLVAELSELVDANTDALETYVRQLIEFGFLEMVWPSSGMDPNWDETLVNWLERLATHDVPLASDLAQGLVALREQATRFAMASSQVRVQILDDAHADFRALFWRIHEAAGLPADERRTPEEMAEVYRQAQKKAELEKAEIKKKAATNSESKTSDADPVEPANNKFEQSTTETAVEKPAQPFRYRPLTVFTLLAKQLFYEDTTRSVEAVLNANALQTWTEQLDQLTQWLSGGFWFGNEQQQMRDFFLRQYPNQPAVPLLTFYEDYYRQIQLPAEEERRRQAQVKPMDVVPDRSPVEESAEAAVETPTGEESEVTQTTTTPSPATDSLDEHLYQFCLNRLQTSRATLGITEAELISILAQANVRPAPPAEPASRAAFVQFYNEQDRLMGVINTPLTGWGRLFSRFLHILDPDVLATQRTWNAQYANGLVLAECVDASYFNANIHPPLMPHELQIPNGHTSLPAAQQLPIADFHLRVAGESLELIHAPSGRPAYCFDLGFQGPAGRSPLFRLVTQFALPGFPSYYRLTYAANRAAVQLQPTGGIRQFSQVVYNGRIVLQRRHWRILTRDTPLREPLETDATYALRLRQWQQQQGIPNEVFVTINEERSGYQPTGEEARRLTRDDYKPQYINFTHPLLVLLFEKVLAKAPGSYRIDEMLPNHQQVVALDDEPLVTECLLQWYTQQPQ